MAMRYFRPHDRRVVVLVGRAVGALWMGQQLTPHAIFDADTGELLDAYETLRLDLPEDE